ncbi:MAG: hypothetical protein EBY37_02820 [Flavobacteriia bacterium]|nr:hypothetical protein [Flavobacteriia bacterium]
MSRFCFVGGIIFIFLLPQFSSGQEQFQPNKSAANMIVLDGKIETEEWKNAVQVPLNYEVNPGNNSPAKKKTIGYITYTDTALYIGIHAFDDPQNIRASIRSRDDFSMYLQDDIVSVRFDTFADGRNNYILVANPFGSQFDVRAINAVTDEDRYDGSF